MLFGKADFHEIKSPLSGKAIALSDLDDPIFSGKVVGDGVAIIPSDGEVVAPVSGEVSFIAPTFHTYGIRGFDGIEVLPGLHSNGKFTARASSRSSRRARWSRPASRCARWISR